MEMPKGNRIVLSTSDKELFEELLASNIDGIKIVNNYRKYSDELPWALIIQLAIGAVTVLAEIIRHHAAKDSTKKTTINDHPVPNQVNNIVVLIKQELTINTDTSDKSKDKPN